MNNSSKHIEKDLWSYIKSSIIITSENGINGNVYRGDTRPDGSSAEDVVVKFLSGNNAIYDQDDFQSGVLVVNIYVNDIAVKGYTRKLADTKRLEELSEMFVGYIESHYDNEYQWYVQETPSVLEAPEIGQHFVNIRVRYSRVAI